MFPDVIKTALEGSIKKVTNVRTIADGMLKYTSLFLQLLLQQNGPSPAYVGLRHT